MSNRGVKVIEIDGVVASSTAVLNKSYKLSRPLFMYTNGKPQGLAKDFLDFILSQEGQKLVVEEGYVSIL
jgi:phosphate transport system substrate-binding protein